MDAGRHVAPAYILKKNLISKTIKVALSLGNVLNLPSVTKCFSTTMLLEAHTECQVYCAYEGRLGIPPYEVCVGGESLRFMMPYSNVQNYNSLA